MPTRRITASSRSTNGIARTANGTIGSSRGSESTACPNAWVSALVVAVVAAAASISPTSIDPESPMKIRAGKKL